MNNTTFTAKVYKMNKCRENSSYFATIRKKGVNELKLKEDNAILLKINVEIFPTLIRKLNTTKNRFMYGFSVPQYIGKKLATKTDIKFGFLSKNLTKENNKNIGNSLYLPKILPRKTVRNKRFYAFDLNDKVLVWIYSTGNKPYVLPKYIPLTRNSYNLLELFGGYLCEGFKARKINTHLDRLSYSSSEIDQMQWFIDSIDNIFGIQKSEWNVQILSSNKTDGFKDYLKEYWSSIGLQKDKIKVIDNATVNDKYGVCLVNIYSSTLAETMHEIFQHCKNMALKNKENSLRFFRGLSRGDLGVTISNAGNTISFTSNSKDNIIFFKKICNNLNIKTGKIIEDKRARKGCWIALIHDFNSFKKIVGLNAITHKRRKFHFYSKFLKCRGCVPFKYLRAVYRGYDTNQKISNHLQLSLVTVIAILSKYRKIGILSSKTKTTDRIHRLHYSLSEKGQKLLEFYSNIEKEIKDNNI